MKKLFVLAPIVSLIFTFNTAHADRTVWYVHPDSAINSIQAGLDSCADNDIVLVAPGTYVENVIWPNTQGIHLISEMGPELTIIDGDSAESVIICSTSVNNTIIRGFTVQNGYSANWGSGIQIGGPASLTITNNIITGNMGEAWGGALVVSGATAIIKNNTIYSNAGFGVLAEGYTMIDSNRISNNDAGGIRGGNDIRNNIITYNGEDGINRPCGIIANNYIANNSNNGIGFYTISNDSKNKKQSCNTFPNELRMNGGNIITNNGVYGIHVDTDPCTLKNETVTYNGTAGILCLCGSSIDSCTIAHNYGHGILFFCTCDNGSVHFCNIFGNVGYGIYTNEDSSGIVDAEYNWWGDSTGPYHPDSNPGGLGDSVSDYVDFIPWLYWPGVEEEPYVDPVANHRAKGSTIFAGPLVLPEGKNCKVFDITGRVVIPQNIKPGIYFIEIDGKITQKVVKVR